MGRINNGKVAKVGGAKALLAAYKRAMPPDAGVWGAVTIGREKIVATKRKIGASVGSKVRSGA